MTTGTKSLLFGVHQFIWHPLTVLRAWIHLYGWPEWRIIVCIIIHDWGYWGCPEMDGKMGRSHPWRGAHIANWLFGRKYFDLVFRHSRYLCQEWQLKPSRLCWADKFSMCFDPQWFYLFRARLSGELSEYRAKADEAGFIPEAAPDRAWHTKLVNHLAVMSKEHAT